MNLDSVVNKVFLEKALGREIESFTMKVHADTGDSFMSVLCSFTVNVKNDPSKDAPLETLFFLCKCFPLNPGRQEFLKEHNLFHRELVFYTQWIPLLFKMQSDLNIKEIVKPNFAHMVAGQAIDFYQVENNRPNVICQPFDNYIMMLDLSAKGFKLADRVAGLDREHALLTIEAYAKIHALGWAYKNHNKIDNLTNIFPNFKFDYQNTTFKTLWEAASFAAVEEAETSLKMYDSLSPELIASLNATKDTISTVMEICLDQNSDKNEAELGSCHRVKLNESTNTTEVPWRVAIHGDSHIGNLLFRYNSDTQKPEEVILIDHQICRESCPVMELVYCLYASTDIEFRQNHLEEMMELYYEKFSYYCKILKTETYPGFTLEELKLRFNRLKIFGLFVNLMFSAVFCKEKDEALQLDSLIGMDQLEIFAINMRGMSKNKKFSEKVVNIVQEMHSEGVI